MQMRRRSLAESRQTWEAGCDSCGDKLGSLLFLRAGVTHTGSRPRRSSPVSVSLADMSTCDVVQSMCKLVIGFGRVDR